MRNHFQIGGHSTEEFDALVSAKRVFARPERDVTVVSVPGRDGDVIIDNGRWLNQTVEYEVCTRSLALLDGVADWLGGLYDGYHELYDTYDPTHFRLATYAGAIDPEIWRLKYGTFTVAFNCHPLRFLRDGVRTITLTETAVIRNPYLRSRPKLTVYGASAAAFALNNQIVTISAIDGYVTIDGGDAFKGATNKNNTVIMPDQLYLAPGENTIEFTSGVTKIEIVPRWCEK